MTLEDPRDPGWEPRSCTRCGDDHHRDDEFCGPCRWLEDEEEAEALREGFVAFRRRR